MVKYLQNDVRLEDILKELEKRSLKTSRRGGEAKEKLKLAFKESILNICLLGPPGAGKGSVGKKLAQTYTNEHIETGVMFRQEVKMGTELGREAEKWMREGLLVPDEIASKMLKERLCREDVCRNGYIMDG